VLGSVRRPGRRSRQKREGAGSVEARPASPALTANRPSDFAELVNELREKWTTAQLGRHSGISGLLRPAFAGLLVPAVPGCFAGAALGGSGWRRGAKSVSVCRKRMSVAIF
jgi:hypothetical protein